MSEPSVAALKEEDVIIRYQCYEGEEQLPLIMNLVDQELSEPYSIFTYRYFISLWPNLCFLAFHGDKCVGTIVCKMGQHRSTFRGYIAMLVVIKPYRGRGIATELVTRCIEVMRASGCDEVALEAEVTNKGALALYGNLGFIRAKRLDKYYLNGADAFRLKLQFPKADLNDFDHRYAEEGCHSCSHEHHDHDHHQAHSHQHYHGHEHGGTCAHNHYHEYQSDQLHWHEHGYHNCHDHK